MKHLQQYNTLNDYWGGVINRPQVSEVGEEIVKYDPELVLKKSWYAADYYETETYPWNIYPENVKALGTYTYSTVNDKAVLTIDRPMFRWYRNGNKRQLLHLTFNNQGSSYYNAIGVNHGIPIFSRGSGPSDFVITNDYILWNGQPSTEFYNDWVGAKQYCDNALKAASAFANSTSKIDEYIQNPLDLVAVYFWYNVNLVSIEYFEQE